MHVLLVLTLFLHFSTGSPQKLPFSPLFSTVSPLVLHSSSTNCTTQRLPGSITAATQLHHFLMVLHRLVYACTPYSVERLRITVNKPVDLLWSRVGEGMEEVWKKTASFVNNELTFDDTSN